MTYPEMFSIASFIISCGATVVAIVRTLNSDAEKLKKHFEARLDKICEQYDKEFDKFIPREQMDEVVKGMWRELHHLRTEQVDRHRENQLRHQSTENKLDQITNLLLTAARRLETPREKG